MERVWVTNSSTSIAPVVNTMAAAVQDGYRPTDIYVLDNPNVTDVTESATSLMKTIVTAYGGSEPRVTVETIDDEMDFAAIATYLKTAIDEANDASARVAVDVTPGRKFWSILGFRAGYRYEVDHLFYNHVASSDFFGESYPTIPRTAVDLVDFTEVF